MIQNKKPLYYKYPLWGVDPYGGDSSEWTGKSETQPPFYIPIWLPIYEEKL